jgi:hypothetical protein
MKIKQFILSLGLIAGILATPAGIQAASTTADDPAVAVVYGQKVYNRDLQLPAKFAPQPEEGATPAEIAALELDTRRQMLATGIWQEARKHYLSKNGLEPTEAEIDSYVEFSKKMQQEMEKDPEIKKINEKNKVGEDPEAERQVARIMVVSWKFNQGLYKQYGGRVIFQQMGLEPIDALKKFLADLKASGDYEIYDPALAKDLFKEQEEYFDKKLDDSSPAEAEKYFATPWWLQNPTKEKQ